MSKPTPMKKSFILLLLVSAAAFGQDMTEISVYFDKNSDEPKALELALLNELTEQPMANQYRFHVTGFTDSTGPKEYNQKLAKGRTNSVVNKLLISGIEPQNILFDYEGKIIDDGAQDEVALAKNRRVDITVFNVGNIAEDGFGGNYNDRLFNRPIPAVTGEVQTYTINACESSRITTSTGTVIDIPGNAFMDAFGRPIEGEVKVNFEEYNDPFSIFLSGITMKVDENGQQADLESAGMFNITASKDDRPIELRPGANINMEFVSTSTDNDFNFYFLDQNSGTWSNIGQASLSDNNNSVETQSYSQAVVEYLSRTVLLSCRKTERPTLDELFWDMEKMQGVPFESAFSFMTRQDVKASKKLRKDWEQRTNIRTRLLPQRKKRDDGAIYLKVENNDHRLNREWYRFKSVVWEYDGAMSRKQVKSILGRQRFQNARILLDNELNSVTLALKNLDTIYQIPVKKVTTRNSSVDYMERRGQDFSYVYYEKEVERLGKLFNVRYRGYARSLERQENRIKKETDQDNRYAERNYKKAMKRAYKHARRYMNDTEKAMDIDTWQGYCADRSNVIENEKIRQLQGQNVVRTLVIDRMGIYNCDRLMKRLDLQTVQPEFALEDGSTLDHFSTYVFEHKTNGVIAYGNGSIKFNPRKLKMILVVDREGRTYRLNESEVLAMQKSRSTQKTMHVTEFDHDPATLDLMKGMLGLAVN